MALPNQDPTAKSVTYPYLLLPFRFMRFPERKMLLVNDVGEHLFVPIEDFNSLLSYNIDPGSDVYLDLKGKHSLI